MSEDLEHVRDHLAEWVAALRATNDELIITNHGKPVAVIIDYGHYLRIATGLQERL